jgi:hypothetical protein
MGAVGFEVLLDTNDLKGTYKLQIYVKQQNPFFLLSYVLLSFRYAANAQGNSHSYESALFPKVAPEPF